MSKLTEAATAALGLKKPAKTEVFQRVRELIEAGNLPPDDAAMFYKFFAPPVPKKPRTDFEWVAQAAAGRNEPRRYLHTLRAIDGVLVATDRHRLHATPTDLPNGAYDVLGVAVGVEEPDRFPRNYARVVPNPREGEAYRLSDIELPVVVTDWGELVRFPTGLHVNHRYWRQAVSRVPSGAEVVVASDRLVVGDGEKVAVIMAVRV